MRISLRLPYETEKSDDYASRSGRLERDVDLPAVPRQGDFIQVGTDLDDVEVKHVVWELNENILVFLKETGLSRSMLQSLTREGWEM